MAAPSKKKATFRDHFVALDAVLTVPLPPVICIYGASEYLLNRAVERLQELAAKQGALRSSIEASSVSEQLASSMLEQGSLFEPSTLYVIRRCEQAKTLQRLLKPLGKPHGGSANVMCFVYKGESPLAPLKAELTRLGARFVPCFDPWPNEVPQIIQGMAKERGIELRHDAIQLLMEAVGVDLVKIDHELTKLALVFIDGGKARDAAQIAPHLGMIREDDAFQLDKLLLAKQWARAHALTDDLIERGEKPVALVGILANHCRNALKISTALRRGARPADLGAGLRLPAFLVKTYAQALVGSDPNRYVRALRQCHEADIRLKSSPFDETLLLAGVLEALAH